MKEKKPDYLMQNEQLNFITTVANNEVYMKLIDSIKIYKIEAQNALEQFPDVNDARVMLYNKILNTLYSYQLELALLHGFYKDNDNNINLVRSAGLLIPEPVNDFLVGHEIYLTFSFYIRLISCIESSLRIFYDELGYNSNPAEYITFNTVYHSLIKKLSLKAIYGDLFDFLTTIRNLMHTLGFYNKAQKTLKYKGQIYTFDTQQFSQYKYLTITFLLDLFNNDIKDFLKDIINSQDMQKKPNIKDNLSSNIQDLYDWVGQPT